MKNKLAVTVGASACGLFAGLLLASGGFKGGLIKALSLAGLGAIPPVFLTHLILDTRFSRKLNDAEGKAFEYSAKLDKSKSFVAELEAKNEKLIHELTTIRQTLEKTILDRDVCRGIIETLKPSIEQLERDLAASKSAAEELQAECDEWESEFHSRVAVEANRQFQESKVKEMYRLCQENDSITDEAMALLRRLQTWGVKVAQGHSQKREIITSLASAYNTN